MRALVFYHEIDELLGYAPRPEAHAGAARATTQQVADAALAADPGRVLTYISWDKDEPGIVMAFTNSAPDGPPDNTTVRAFDAVSAKLLGPVGVGPMMIMLRLHTDMFAGQAGKLFLGAMGLLFAVAMAWYCTGRSPAVCALPPSATALRAAWSGSTGTI